MTFRSNLPYKNVLLLTMLEGERTDYIGKTGRRRRRAANGRLYAYGIEPESGCGRTPLIEVPNVWPVLKIKPLDLGLLLITHKQPMCASGAVLTTRLLYFLRAHWSEDGYLQPERRNTFDL